MKMRYALLTLESIWEKATVVAGQDPSRWRKDACGARIFRDAYGDRNSRYGWEVDHVVPKSRGGSDELENLRPLHCENNAGRLNGPLRIIVTSSGERNVRP